MKYINQNHNKNIIIYNKFIVIINDLKRKRIIKLQI